MLSDLTLRVGPDQATTHASLGDCDILRLTRNCLFRRCRENNQMTMEFKTGTVNLVYVIEISKFDVYIRFL